MVRKLQARESALAASATKKFSMLNGLSPRRTLPRQYSETAGTHYKRCMHSLITAAASVILHCRSAAAPHGCTYRLRLVVVHRGNIHLKGGHFVSYIVSYDSERPSFRSPGMGSTAEVMRWLVDGWGYDPMAPGAREFRGAQPARPCAIFAVQVLQTQPRKKPPHLHHSRAHLSGRSAESAVAFLVLY
ncbi:hypothetical protein ABBQ32_006365 [Trebouxia sp. C0010 RCD-2024]